MKLNWTVNFMGNLFIQVQATIKNVKKALSEWSRATFENIFQNIATLENAIKVKEAQFEFCLR